MGCACRLIDLLLNGGHICMTGAMHWQHLDSNLYIHKPLTSMSAEQAINFQVSGHVCLGVLLSKCSVVAYPQLTTPKRQ